MKIRTALFMTVMLLLVPALCFGMASFDFPVVAPVVSFVEGDVTIKGAGAADWEDAEEGRLLASGDTVRTGPASKAEISCATGKMRLYENTVIIVPEVVDEGEKKDIRKVELDDGTGLFRIKKRGVERGFEVKTTNVIAGVKGTLFAVLHDKPKNVTRVAVWSGTVEVTDPSKTPGTSTSLSRGQRMGVQDGSGFGDKEDFEPGDVWDGWEKPDALGIDWSSVTGQGSAVAVETEGERDDTEVECDPVTDGDGNPIYY